MMHKGKLTPVWMVIIRERKNINGLFRDFQLPADFIFK